MIMMMGLMVYVGSALGPGSRLEKSAKPVSQEADLELLLDS